VAAPKDAPELAFRLRKFQGTNTDLDSAFLGPSLVTRSENWAPTQAYRLGKRPGTTLLSELAGGVLSITDLLVTNVPGGLSVLYAYCRTSTNAVIASSIAEAVPFLTNPPNVSFPNKDAVGRMVRFRDRVYAGNGVDPMKTWKVGDPAGTTPLTLGALGLLTGGSVIAVPSGTQASQFALVAPGTYQCCWALYDTVQGIYLSRTNALTDPATAISPGVVVTTGTNDGGMVLECTAPSAALAANQVYRLFIAPRNFPLEYATAQGADWKANEKRRMTAIDVSDFRVPIGGVMRTGNMLLVWRNRVVFAGMRDEPFSIFSTDTILPGTEQTTFNQGVFFPFGAVVKLPDTVTGIGTAGVTTDLDVTAPLLFFTASRTFLCQGDPFSTTEPATLLEVSSRVGCVSHDSIVNTPAGTIFVGMDSVYLIPPDGGYPQDIGWPIADQIRAVHPGVRKEMCAVFHKQFYKLALPPGESGEWWLDLRQGVTQIPSWWGPMTAKGRAFSAMVTDPNNVEEIDRGYGAVAASDRILRIHQVGIYTDSVPISGSGSAGSTVGLTGITSVLRSGRFDADMPFDAKVFTRLRLIAVTNGESQIEVLFETDGGETWPWDAILLGRGMRGTGKFRHTVAPVPPGPAREESWNHLVPEGLAQFGTVAPVEVQTISPARRPRGLSAVVTLMHGPEPTAVTQFLPQVELRDFELLFLPVVRKVRYLQEAIGK